MTGSVTAPVVGVVVVNYNGGADTLRCLDALAASDWPAGRLRIVLVDNASTDGVADAVAAERPAVEVVRSATNLGFAGGCNLAFARLGLVPRRERATVDHVALVNPDAVVEPGWLRALVAAMGSATDVGAVAAKVLLDGEFAEIAVDAPVTVRGRADRRRLGVRVSGVEVDGVDVWRDTQFVSGTWGPEQGHRWTADHAVLRVPAGKVARLRLSAPDDKTAVVSSATATRHDVGRAPAWYEVELADEYLAVVNSAGVELLADGYGGDRGYLAVDDGRYDRREEVFGWSGSAVLLSGRYLAEVGSFDDRLFMYYEDFDLSWRGRLLGWRYLYEPAAVVRHRHATSSVIGSPLFDHHVERNRLLTVTRNAPGAFALGAIVRYLLITVSYARRDVVAPVLRGRGPTLTAVARRCRSFGGFLRLVPATLVDRRRQRRRRRLDDATVMAWLSV